MDATSPLAAAVPMRELQEAAVARRGRRHSSQSRVRVPIAQELPPPPQARLRTSRDRRLRLARRQRVTDSLAGGAGNVGNVSEAPQLAKSRSTPTGARSTMPTKFMRVRLGSPKRQTGYAIARVARCFMWRSGRDSNPRPPA